ncbi:MAG: hypothetical protein JO249_24465 [Acidobacteria bacterium]|nr:hypothetical protein [Acidobacteriota bacterium]
MLRSMLFAVTLILFVAPVSFASDIYFAPTAQGSNNGSNCASAYAYNDNGHGWSLSAQQGPGNILHICAGTYNAAAGSTIFSTASAGASGSPITLVADQGAATLQAPYFSTGGALSISRDFWVINGNNNLTIQNTLNGTPGATCPGGPCSYQQQSVGVSIGGNNVTVENMKLRNYVHKSGDSCCTPTLFGIMGLGLSNIAISGNTINGNRVAINLWGSNITINNNTLTDNSAAWWFGSGSATSGVAFHDNYMANVGNWNAGGFHLEYVHLFTFSGAISGLQLYNNYFGNPNCGPAPNCSGTAKFYHEGSSSGESLFNNIFWTDDGFSYLPAIEFETQTGGGGFSHVNPRILNNTINGGNQVASGNTGFFFDTGVSGLIWQNNVVLGGETLVSFPSDAFASGGADYNAYENTFLDLGTGPFAAPCPMSGNPGGCTTLSAWQSDMYAGSGKDINSTFNTLSNLNINTQTGVLGAGSPIIGKGTNLTNLGIAALGTGAPQSFGAGGGCGAGCQPRPATGSWDPGAYPHGSSSSAGPNPPTMLTATTH